LTDKEYYILLASLLYSVDKVANTVGHFDAYLKKEVLDDNFIMKQIDTMIKWDKPKLYGVVLKPEPENMSDYCKNNARHKSPELVKDIKAECLVVSYNNTYDSKSNSSRDKITLKKIEMILMKKGSAKIFEKDCIYFNAGSTDFKNHKEYLFVTKVKWKK